MPNCMSKTPVSLREGKSVFPDGGVQGKMTLGAASTLHMPGGQRRHDLNKKISTAFGRRLGCAATLSSNRGSAAPGP